MKHRVRKLALLLVLALLLSTLALAADKATVTPANGAALEFIDSSQNNLTLTQTGVTDGGMYLVLVLAGEEKDGVPLVPTENNILYINQTTADENGTVTFDNVYPSSLVDSTVYLSGTELDGLTKMGEIDLKVMLGDISNDGNCDAVDATFILQNVVGGSGSFTDQQKMAADVNGDGYVDAVDATLILQKIVGLISKFPIE